MCLLIKFDRGEEQKGEVGGYEVEEESRPEKDEKLERLENPVWGVALGEWSRHECKYGGDRWNLWVGPIVVGKGSSPRLG